MKSKKFTWSDAHILQEIACHQHKGGADPKEIAEGVDFRQRYELSDRELINGLKRLNRANLILNEKGRFTLSESIDSMIPRTAQGSVSFRSDAWEELYARVMGLK